MLLWATHNNGQYYARAGQRAGYEPQRARMTGPSVDLLEGFSTLMRDLKVHVLFRFSCGVINVKGNPSSYDQLRRLRDQRNGRANAEIRVSSNLRREVGTEGPSWSRNGELQICWPYELVKEAFPNAPPHDVECYW